MEPRHRLESAERALEDREITFAALAKVAPVGIMRFDAEGRCNYVNDRWTDIAGLTIDQAIGDGWQTAVHPADLPNVTKGWADLRLQEDVFREEYRICRPDGNVRWVLAEGVPLRTYSGRLIGFIRAVTDVSVHHQLEAELKASRSDLEQRVQERTAQLEAEIQEREKLEKRVLEIKDAEQRRFSEDLHDGLGQYLTGILFRVLALQRELEHDDSRKAENAAKIAELVHQTIGQTHDLARGINPVPVEPTGLIVALQDLQQRLCHPKLVDCSLIFDEAIRIAEPTTATHLFRIAQEAVTNALKYARASKITITLGKRHDVGELRIEDNGIGFQLEAARRRGSGLAIMKHRSRVIKGSLQIRTSEGGGTSVRCEFPLGESCHGEKV